MSAVIAPKAPDWVPGVYDHLPAAEYHAMDGLSSGGVKLMARSPAHYLAGKLDPRKSTAAMNLGSAVHAAILEPATFESEVVLMPTFNRRTNVGKEDAAAWEAMHGGKVWLDAEDMERALAMVQSVRNHAGAQMLLEEGKPEVSLLWEDARYGARCRGRIDWRRSDGGLIDLKTTADASPEGFARQAANLAMHVQAAHYWSGVEHLRNESPKYWAWITVENEAPFCTAVYVLQADALRIGMARQGRAVERYAAAIREGRFAGYPETIEPLPFPAWALREAVR